MSQPLTAFFRRVELFRSLDDAELGELLRAITPVDVAAGQCVFREGDASDAAYAIEQGRVEIVTAGKAGEVFVAELGPGDVLGELALLDGAPRSATARAKTRVTLFRIDQREFDFLRRNLRPAAYKVIRTISLTLCERLRETNNRLRSMMSDPPAAIPPPLADEPPPTTRPIEVKSAARRPEREERAGLLGRLNFWSNR
ncbi:MAG: cyclic nucleotide-binding domain-containing protein [Myxococcales bacterium]|nr:cyclic nucleotide-binding domain-containing protein [Myxococcales bacterium]